MAAKCWPGAPDIVCEVAGATPLGQVVGGAGAVAEAGGAVADAAQTAYDFGSDPIGFISDALRGAAQSLAQDVLPTLVNAMEPDLTASWFREAYAITFAVAILAWVGQLIWAFVQQARRQISNSEMVDILIARSPMFLLGCAFGPAFGGLIVKLLGYLTNDVLKWAVGGTAADISDGIAGLLDDGSAAEVSGGVLVAAVIYLVMILGLLLCVLTLVVMLVTLYLSGVAFPLGWQYITSAKQKNLATKIPKIWIGILLSHPLMFFLLGLSLKMASGTLLQGELPGNESEAPTGVRLLVGLLVACVALWMTALSPLMLSKFAPIMPTGASAGDGVTAASIPRPSMGSKGGSGKSSGLARQSESDSGDLDAGSAGGPSGGGGDLVSASVGGGSGAGAQGGSGTASAASQGAESGAMKAGEAGAETGPGDVAIMAAGAAVGAAGGAMKDAMGEATDQAGEASGAATADAGSGGGADVSQSSSSDSATQDGSDVAEPASAAGTLAGSGAGTDTDSTESPSGSTDVPAGSSTEAGGTSGGTGGVTQISAASAGDASGAAGSGGSDAASTHAQSPDAGESAPAGNSSGDRGSTPKTKTGSSTAGLGAMMDGFVDVAVSQANEHTGDKQGGPR